MGCSCCANEINKNNSYFKEIQNKRISKIGNDNNTNNNRNNLRIESIGSVNSINFNDVLNIIYKNSIPNYSHFLFEIYLHLYFPSF